MKLDRNINGNGRGKYGLIKNRELKTYLLKAKDGRKSGVEAAAAVVKAIVTLERAGIIDWGTTPETEFFVMRLKDRCAGPALKEYALAARPFDGEYAEDMRDLANRSGLFHRLCRMPD